jgi:predicted nucleotidyltransferase
VKAREGDLIETKAGLIFDVKGLTHPPNKIIAFPRFIPDALGNRKRKNASYAKVYALSKRFEFLENNFPQYLVHDTVFDERLCEIPFTDVKKHYKPIEKLQQLRKSRNPDMLETQVLHLAELLKENANIPWNAIGVSGSILAELHTPKSDIDPIVYGSENCWKVYSALKRLLNDGQELFKPYRREDLKVLFEFRSKDTAADFEDFVRSESRKTVQGKFAGTDYFIRFVKDWNEVKEKYGDVQYRNVGYAKIEAVVADETEAIFTPCKYEIEKVTVIEGPKLPISEIASFRGRFCEQARAGERVIAQGKVEHVKDIKRDRECYRILLGNKPSDFFVLA